ncbi:MAG TPA: hypothetical protein VGH64_10920 [Puia sp.]
MTENIKRPGFLYFLPVSLFGAVMSTTGLSFASGWAEKLFLTKVWVRTFFAGMAVTLFIILSIAYILKTIKYPGLVKQAFSNPVAVSFFGMPIISMLLLAGIIHSLHVQVLPIPTLI